MIEIGQNFGNFFVKKEIELYHEDFADSVKELFSSILNDENDESKIRQKLYEYFSSKTESEITKEEKLVLLASFLMCYWSKEYELII